MRKLAHSARNKQWEHTTPPTVYVKSDLPASSSQSPKELRGRAHSVDDGRRCAKDLRAARPRTPNEYELFFQACSLEDKSKDDRMPTRCSLMRAHTRICAAKHLYHMCGFTPVPLLATAALERYFRLLKAPPARVVAPRCSAGAFGAASHHALSSVLDTVLSGQRVSCQELVRNQIVAGLGRGASGRTPIAS